MREVNFKRLDIENFLSVGDETVSIDFTTGINLITGVNHDKEDSKNGVGKTTVADALFFCLFGETIRELKKDEIINNINQKRCRVNIEFEVQENDTIDTYRVERKITPNKLIFEKNGEDVTKSSMVKTTEELSKILGASAEVFRNSVIMTVNGTIPFMAQKKVEKRKFCEGLFNLGVFQDMLLESRKRYNEVKSEISIEQAKVNEVGNTLKIYKEQKNKKESSKKDRISVLLKRKSDNTSELSKLTGSVKEAKVESITECKENIKLLETKLSSIQKTFRSSIGDIATKEEQIKTKKENIKTLKSFGDVCDTCKRSFTDFDKDEQKNKISLITKEIENIKSDISTIKGEQVELENLKSKCLLAISKQNDTISDVNKNIEKNKNIQSRIDQLTSWNKQIEVDIKELNDDCKEFDDIISASRNRFTSLMNTVDDLTKRSKILDSVKYIVSEEGVKSYIIKKILSILNSKLAYYLNKMDAPCHFKFNEYFDEQIINEKGQECSYNNFSSGEKKRIDLAILFTFMDIRRLQGNTSINISFYDEILDTSLDDKGIELFLDILTERVENNNESCYIISHKNNAIKTVINDIIMLEKKNGFTTIAESVD